MTAPGTPTAAGSLETTPFAHLVAYIHQQGLTGTLVIEDASGWSGAACEDWVLFDAGAPVAARLAQPASSLELGLLRLFGRVAGTFSFYEGHDLGGDDEGVVRGAIDPFALLAASLRGATREDAVESVLARLGETRLRLRPGLDIRRFALEGREAAFVDLLRAEPATVAELMCMTPDGKLARRVLYLLAVVKGVEPFTAEMQRPEQRQHSSPGAQNLAQHLAEPRAPRTDAPVRSHQSRHPPGEATLPAPSRPPSLPSHLRERWDEILRRVAAIEQENYFQMLGLPREAGAAAIRDAYFELAKKWHPDTLPAELAQLRPHAEQVFRHLTSARDTLSDDKARGKYIRVVQDGGGTPAEEKKVAAIVQAAMEFQKAEVLLKRRDYDGALAMIETAISLSADEADYHALHAWVIYQQHAGPDAPMASMLAAVDRALALRESCERAHHYKGMILKRAGKGAQALVHFRRAAELNPRNVEAVREVRLATMRGTGRTSSALDGKHGGRSDRPAGSSDRPKTGGVSGALSRLFGGDKKGS